MLRYFYILLCLLVCLDWSFCYDYISEEYKPRRMANGRLRHRRRKTEVRYHNSRHNEVVGDYFPKSKIDVASFVQKPEYDSIDEIRQDEITTNVDAGLRTSRERPDHRFPSKKNEENTNDRNRIHSLESYNYNPNINLGQLLPNKRMTKTCDRKRRIPFFSPKKSKSTGRTKPTTKKKIRLFGVGKKKFKTKPTEKSVTQTLQINKRSYGEQKCPFCKRKYPINTSFQGNNVVHNSRQYFQNLASKVEKESKRKLSTKAIPRPRDDKRYGNQFYGRIKRQFKDYERERQLKELKEVQKKIDSVEIITYPPTMKSPQLI